MEHHITQSQNKASYYILRTKHQIISSRPRLTSHFQAKTSHHNRRPRHHFIFQDKASHHSQKNSNHHITQSLTKASHHIFRTKASHLILGPRIISHFQAKNHITISGQCITSLSQDQSSHHNLRQTFSEPFIASESKDQASHYISGSRITSHLRIKHHTIQAKTSHYIVSIKGITLNLRTKHHIPV